MGELRVSGAFDSYPGKGEFWDIGPTADRLRQEFPDAVLEVRDFRGERTVVVAREKLFEVLAFLRDDPETDFDFLTDVTAVHWPAREEPFDIVYHLYSMSRNRRLRVKCRVPDPPTVPSVVALWPTANWLERECYDMFGVTFEGHPDLRRILMPEDYEGWPLRKEFPLKC
ncbi:MAG: NADH-quinone oxidoreductase subunit C [Acidobacteria bacterium]|nr:MAG: NADH-quinone oxidoreductase subunit C [Acidobacteriota bacterium]